MIFYDYIDSNLVSDKILSLLNSVDMLDYERGLIIALVALFGWLNVLLVMLK